MFILLISYNTENTTQDYNALMQHGTYNTQNITRKYNMHTTHHTAHMQHEDVNITQKYNTLIQHGTYNKKIKHKNKTRIQHIIQHAYNRDMFIQHIIQH